MREEYDFRGGVRGKFFQEYTLIGRDGVENLANLESLWCKYARRFSQTRIRSELKRSWPDDPNILQDRLEFSYPPTFQPGYVGPLFFGSPLRVLFLGRNPGVGRDNVEGDKELSKHLDAFGAGKLTFAEFNVFIAGHLANLNCRSLFSDKGVFAELDERRISLLPQSERPSIRSVALLNWFPFKTVCDKSPLRGSLRTATWQFYVKPTIELLRPSLIVRYPDSDSYEVELAGLQSSPKIIAVWHPSARKSHAEMRTSWARVAKKLRSLHG